MNNMRKLVIGLITTGLIIGVVPSSFAAKQSLNSTSAATKVKRSGIKGAEMNHFTAPVTIVSDRSAPSKLTKGQVVFSTNASTAKNAPKLIFRLAGKTPRGQNVLTDGIQTFTYTNQGASYTVTPYVGRVL